MKINSIRNFASNCHVRHYLFKSNSNSYWRYLESEDYGDLRNKINSTNRYKRLIELREEISKLKGKLPFSVISELTGRIEERIQTFECPVCSDASIKIMFINGSIKDLEEWECKYALEREMKLSDYIFSKYYTARDFLIDMSKPLGIYAKDGQAVPSSPQKEKANVEVLQTRVEHLIKVVDHMNKVYAEKIPKIANDISEINGKLELLYKKIMESEARSQPKPS